MRPLLILAAAVLAVASLAGAGCEGISYLAQGMTGEGKVPAMHTLDDRPTAVLVDDPAQRLGDPALEGIVAASTARFLERSGALTATIVPEKELAALRQRLGDDYARTPVDQIGRLLGAGQVIYVRIEDATLQPAPGLYRPTALAEVKVIDATAGKRVFPAGPTFEDTDARVQGHPLKVELFPKDIHNESRGTDAALVFELANQVGRHTAELFYEHMAPRPFN